MGRFTLILAFTALGLVAGVLFWPRGQDEAAAPAAESGEATTTVTRLRGEAARARERAAAFDRQASAALQASDRATLATAALAARVQQAEAALAAAEADLGAVTAQRRVLDARLARERAPVAQLLAGLQAQLRRPPLLELLQPGSIEDSVHMRAVLAAVAPQVRARTAGLRGELDRARLLEQRAAQIAGRRRALQSDLVTRREQLAARSAAERIKARRAAGSADREAERAFAIGEEARDLTTLVDRLQAGGRDNPGRSPPLPTRAGGFRLPVTGFLDAAPVSASRAIALIPRPGALVTAPRAGRVAFAGPYRGYGAIVIIEHPDGWTSLVTGLAATQVAVGQPVVAGSPIGQAPARAPRIGFELRHNGEPANPLDQLR